MVIFLNYDPEGKMVETADMARRSIFENSLGWTWGFSEIKNVSGFVNAVNQGLDVFKEQKADFVIFVANDVEIKDKKWIDKMVEPNSISAWRKSPFYLTGEMMPDFACWGISKEVFDKLGYMDKAYENGYGFDDNDYCLMAKELGIRFHDAGVKLTHHENKTYQTYFSPLKEAMTERNHNIFMEKWGNKLK